jgi:hypothetical protein
LFLISVVAKYSKMACEASYVQKWFKCAFKSTGLYVYSPVAYTKRWSGSVAGIATSYGLDGPGIEFRWGARFSVPVQTDLGAHPFSCTMGTGSFPGGKERPGRDADPSPPTSAVGHKRVELYLYFPYGPYGLYRDSVPVQGCTLTLLYV